MLKNGLLDDDLEIGFRWPQAQRCAGFRRAETFPPRRASSANQTTTAGCAIHPDVFAILSSVESFVFPATVSSRERSGCPSAAWREGRGGVEICISGILTTDVTQALFGQRYYYPRVYELDLAFELVYAFGLFTMLNI
jgi:hypothetical protein